MIKFAGKWGLLEDDNEELGMDLVKMTWPIVGSVGSALSHIEQKKFDDLRKIIPQNGFGQYTTTIDYDSKNRTPVHVFKAKSLLSFVWAQLFQLASEDHNIKRCLNCEDFFAVGPGTGHSDKRKYCSARCKTAYRRQQNGG